MKIKMIVSIAGADFALAPGGETERFSQDEAERMIAAGIAAPVHDDEEPEPSDQEGQS